MSMLGVEMDQLDDLRHRLAKAEAERDEFETMYLNVAGKNQELEMTLKAGLLNTIAAIQALRRIEDDDNEETFAFDIARSALDWIYGIKIRP
jgi:hypothetical protein